MTFTPENDLERALMRAPQEPDARPLFYRLLLDSKLFIIGQIGPSQADAANDQLMIATLSHDGREHHPVFSALSRLKSFAQEDVGHLTFDGRALFEATRGASFILNPGSECGKLLVPDEIASILSDPANQPMRARIGQPKVYPQALVNGLSELFAKRPEVIGAHLVEIAVEGSEEPPHPMIGVETEGDWQALSQAMGEVMKTTPLETIVDMLPIDRAEPTGIMQALLQTRPFYSRDSKAKLS
jgi:hypothetical protein